MSVLNRGGRVGRLSRLGTGIQVTTTILLAVALVLLVNWLAGRPGIRQRFDLTSADRNTLATATKGTLERIEDSVLIEVLQRVERGPRQQIELEVMQRTRMLLQLIQEEAGGKVEVKDVDTTDVATWAQRQREMRLPGFENGLLVSRGKQRTFLRIDGGLAQIQAGRRSEAGFVPPAIIAFTAEEGIVEAILDVTRGEELLALFTQGHGEPSIDDGDVESPEGIGIIAGALEKEGFNLQGWSHAEDGALPEECDVLVVLGPDSQWPEEQYSEILDFAERGGRMIVVPATDPSALRRSDVPDLLKHFDLEVSEGRLATRLVDPRTGVPIEGRPECERIVASAAELSTHIMVRPIRDAGRVLGFYQAHPIRIIKQPLEGLSQALVSVPGNRYWLDVPTGPDQRCNQVFEPGIDGQEQRYSIAATVQRPPMQDVDQASGLDDIREIRIVALGSAYVFTNDAMRTESLVPAAFNWVSDREHRITIPPKDPDLRMLPRDDPKAILAVTNFAQIYLPGLAAVLGVLVWFLRSRGSRRRPAASEPS